ncbi:MAG: hypothetical protein JO369_04225 [Paucibacter sp.]|nr:hypothetical protein [Roseateles sp.]MBV8379957.1 hypothetical protein [Roseateles sp.]
MTIDFVLLGLCALALFFALWQRQAAQELGKGRWAAGFEVGRKQANAAYLALERRDAAYERLIGDPRSGIGKRIAQVREAAETVPRGPAGDATEAGPGPLHLLHDIDAFLTALLDIYIEEERDANNAQMRSALARSATVFAEVADRIGVAQPGAVVGKNFSIGMSGGRVSIRSTGRHGAAGQIKLAKGDVARFFNDAVGKPRSLMSDKNAGLVCKGFYRVDVKGDPRFGQLTLVAAPPSTGSIYLGLVDQEDDQLMELRSLRRICDRLFQEASTPVALKSAERRARILRRGTLHSTIPDSGRCPSCESDVTTQLKMGDKPTACPICAASWAG